MFVSYFLKEKLPDVHKTIKEGRLLALEFPQLAAKVFTGLYAGKALKVCVFVCMYACL